MKLRLIYEALLGYHVGDVSPVQSKYDDTGFLNNTDYAKPKLYEILSKKLSRSLRHNIIILVGRDLDRFAGNDRSKLAELSKITGIREADFERAVTLLIVGDNGQTQVSPWLILHQLGEGMASFADHDVWFNFICKRYGRFLKRAPQIDPAISNHAKSYGRSYAADTEYQWGIRAWHQLFKMRSARELRHGDFDNIDPGQELVVEFLWHGGRVRINHPDWLPDGVADEIKADIEFYLDAALSKLVGYRISNNIADGDVPHTNYYY